MTHPPGALRPRLESRHPLRCSAHYSRDLADRVDEWFLSWDLLRDESQRRVFRRTDHTYLAAVCWPRCDAGILYDLARLAAALMARDHEIDTAPADTAISMARAFLTEVRARYDLDGVRGTDPRWAPVFTELWHSLSTRRSPRFMDRLATALTDFLTGCLSYRRRGPATPRGARAGGELDGYLSTRRLTVAQRIDHLLIEAGLGIELDDDVLADPLMGRLLHLDVDRTILIQDTLSAPRELADGESENLVAVLATDHGCSAQRALHEAMALYDGLTDAYEQAHAALLDSPTGRDPNVRAFAGALNDFSAGLIEWTSHSVRYTRAEKSIWNQPDEIID
ncbi:terpene synthase family protein [Streptomyces sediminimaris]|uniref:terpene synthase family protein n=1 Tax=Streptomyces sediminimaris TaxID=3383721 RepID=UPI00399BA6DD